MEPVIIMTVLVLGFAIAVALAFGALDLLFATIAPAPYRSEKNAPAPLAMGMEMVEK